MVVGRELDLTNQLSLISGLLISEELEGYPLNVLHWLSKHRTHWPLCILSTFREQRPHGDFETLVWSLRNGEQACASWDMWSCL